MGIFALYEAALEEAEGTTVDNLTIVGAGRLAPAPPMYSSLQTSSKRALRYEASLQKFIDYIGKQPAAELLPNVVEVSSAGSRCSYWVLIIR